jgi:DNA-binding ferritin-like protein (Dps family)
MTARHEFEDAFTEEQLKAFENKQKEQLQKFVKKLK